VTVTVTVTSTSPAADGPENKHPGSFQPGLAAPLVHSTWAVRPFSAADVDVFGVR